MMVFHWCLRDRKSSEASRTLLSILGDLKILYFVHRFPSLTVSKDCSIHTNYNWCHSHSFVPQLFFFVLWHGPCTCLCFRFLLLLRLLSLLLSLFCYFWRVFTLAFADDLSMEFERQGFLSILVDLNNAVI